jgi:hypothetical protein
MKIIQIFRKDGDIYTKTQDDPECNKLVRELPLLLHGKYRKKHALWHATNDSRQYYEDSGELIHRLYTVFDDCTDNTVVSKFHRRYFDFIAQVFLFDIRF